MLAWAILLAASLMLARRCRWRRRPSAPLVLEAKIPLGEVSGRIDHLGIDVKRQRLFVAELGNNSLGVVDLAAGKVLRTDRRLERAAGRRLCPVCRQRLCGECRRRLGAGAARRGSCADRAHRARRRCRQCAGRRSAQPGAGRLRQGCACGHRSGKPDQDRRYPSQSAIRRVSRSTKPGPRSLSMCRTRARSRSSTLRRGSTPIVADARGGIEFSDGDRW